MYGSSRVNVEAQPCSTFTSTRDASILFAHVNFTVGT